MLRVQVTCALTGSPTVLAARLLGASPPRLELQVGGTGLSIPRGGARREVLEYRDAQPLVTRLVARASHEGGDSEVEVIVDCGATPPSVAVTLAGPGQHEKVEIDHQIQHALLDLFERLCGAQDPVASSSAGPWTR